jgi:hypothetical protein
MKKLFALLLLSAGILFFGACKKEENKPEATETKRQAAPANAQKKRRPAGSMPLRMFREQDLVATVPPQEYKTLPTTKIKVGAKEFSAIPVRDLLQKYNLQGKNVTLGGPGRSATLTWEQVTTNEVYVYLGPRQRLQLYAPTHGTTVIKLPAQLVRIVVSEKPPEKVARTPKKQNPQN